MIFPNCPSIMADINKRNCYNTLFCDKGRPPHTEIISSGTTQEHIKFYVLLDYIMMGNVVIMSKIIVIIDYA